MNIQELRKQGRNKLINANICEAPIKADILLQYVLNISKTDLILNSNKEVTNEQEQVYIEYIEKIISGKPIQYITNVQEFMKLKFYVDENVLIPQPDTEVLVEETIKRINEYARERVEILDLCTGSGAVAISLEHYLKDRFELEIFASDVSKEAIEVANKNELEIEKYNNIQFILSNMFENIKTKKFDIIVSNPPYIERNVIPTLSIEVQNEPNIALDGGIDGLDYYRIIAKEGYKYVKSNGYILVEIGYNQAESVTNIFKNHEDKYTNIKCIKDLSGKDRVIEIKVK